MCIRVVWKHTRPWSDIQSGVTSVKKCAHVYQREDNFSSITFKMRKNFICKHIQNIKDEAYTPLYPHRQSVDHCDRPQSMDTNFVLGLSKCPHFDGVILTLVLALNDDWNTEVLNIEGDFKLKCWLTGGLVHLNRLSMFITMET